MHKSFIFTFTTAILCSVAYCQTKPCEVEDSKLCDAFCTTPVMKMKPDVKAKSASCEKNKDFGSCHVKFTVPSIKCEPEVANVCSTFLEKVPQGVCFCKMGDRPSCTVKVGQYYG